MSAMPVATALRVIEAARAEADARGAMVSVAVVDDGGNLVAFARMDGAEIAGPTLAIDKAYTAVAHRMPTDELAPLTAPGGELFGLQANGGGRYVVFGGGVPLRVDERVVGAVGVSGSTVANDVAIADAADRAFTEESAATS